MKELSKLSVQEKAKRYDEILARAEGANLPYYKEEIMAKVKEFVDYLLPELKESEDERVKRILHSISSKMSFHLHDIFTEEEFQCFDAWFNAWLEKQGEQKSVSITDEWIEDYWKNEKVNNPHSYDKGDEIQFDHQGFVSFCKKYCQKPSDEYEWSGKIKKRKVKGVLKEMLDKKLKSTWSEEDVKVFNRISAILLDASEVKNWWKEYRLIERDEMIRLTDFLKSLKDKYTWKPSDEQMKFLWKYAEQNNYDGSILTSLYNDLKKLKG